MRGLVPDAVMERLLTLSFIHFDRLYLVHQVVGAPLGDVLDEDLLVVGEVLCGENLQCINSNRSRQEGAADFTVSVEELVVGAVLGVSGDALHPPL